MIAAAAETPGRPRLRLREAFVFFAGSRYACGWAACWWFCWAFPCAMAFLAILLGTERIMAGLQQFAPPRRRGRPRTPANLSTGG